MFQYISEIIKNISPKQRVLALFITLLFIFLITFGGKLITVFSQTDKTLELRVQRLEKSNIELSHENEKLHSLVLESEIQCSKDITLVRKQLLMELGILEKEMTTTNNTVKLMMKRDSVSPNISETVVTNLPNKTVISHLKKMKSDLIKKIDNK